MKALLGGGKSRALRRSKIKESKTPAIATVDSVEVVDDGSVLSSSSELPRPRSQGTDQQPETTPLHIHELTLKLEESESMLATRNEDVQKLKDLNTKMQTELEDMMLRQSASNFGNEKRISELEARLTLKESQKVEAIRSEMNIQVDALQNQALEKEKQYSELTAILAAMTKEVSNLEEVSNKRSEESDNLKKGLEEQKGLNTDLGKKLDAKDEAIQRARKDIELKLNDIESLKTKQDAAIVNITTSYTKEIGLLKEQLAKNESELEGVITSRSIQSDSESKQEGKLKELQSQLAKAEAANKKMQLKTNAATEAAKGSKVALERDSAEHKAELERVNKAHIIQVSELRKAIQLTEAEKNEIAANFSKEKQKEDRSNQVHSNQVSELRKAIQLVEAEKAEITASFAKETEAENQKRTKKIAKIKELKDALNESKRALEIAVAQEKTIKEEHASKMQQLQKDNDAQIAKLKLDFSKQSQLLTAEIVAQEKTIEKLRLERDSAAATGEKTNKEVERQALDTCRCLALDHKSELDRMNKDHEAKVTKLENLVKERETDSVEAQTRFINEKETQINISAQTEKDIQKLKENLISAQQSLDMVVEEKKLLQKEQDDRTTQSEKLSATLANETDVLRQEIRGKDGTIEKLKKDNSIRAKKAASDTEEQKHTLVHEHAAKLQEMQKTHDALTLELNASHTSEIKALKTDLSTKSKQTRKIQSDQDEKIAALTTNKIELQKELAGLQTKMANATKSYENRIADLETRLKKDATLSLKGITDLETRLKKDETLLLKVRSELDTEKMDKEKKLNTAIGKRTELEAQIYELQSRIKKTDSSTSDLHTKLAKEREEFKEWKMKASSMQQQEAKAAMTRDLPSIIDPAMQRKQKTIWRKLLFTLVFFGSFIWIGAQLSTNENLQNDLQILLKTRDMREIGSIAVEEMRAMKGRLSYAPEAFSSKDGSPFHRFKLVALDELNMIKNRFEKATTEFTSRDRAVTETEDRLEKDRMLPDDSTALAAKDKEQAAQRKVAEMLAEKEQAAQRKVAEMLAEKEQAAQRKVAEMLAEKEALEQEIAAMRAVQESSEEQSDSLGLEKEALNKQLQDQVAAVTSERDTLQQQIIFIQERIGSLSEAQSGLQKSIHNILEKSVKMLDT